MLLNSLASITFQLELFLYLLAKLKMCGKKNIAIPASFCAQAWLKLKFTKQGTLESVLSYWDYVWFQM